MAQPLVRVRPVAQEKLASSSSRTSRLERCEHIQPVLLLLAVLQVASMNGHPPPGKPIRKLPAFVTDTIFPAVGGRYDIRRSHGASPLGPDNTAATFAPPHHRQGDTTVVFYKKPTDYIQAHEAGHILDLRQLAGPAFEATESRREPDVNDYSHLNREEYVAEAFARALLSGRKGFADSTQVDRQFPGAIELIRWLQTRPPFAASPSDSLLQATKPR